jgi:uncharacterized protein YbjT (DUF2867 family)
MRNVLILGASGNIARKVTDLLSQQNDIQLTLFVRKAARLKNRPAANCRIVEGDALNLNDVQKAMTGQDIIYANLAGDLENMAKNIIKAMSDAGVKRLIFISSIGIYDQPLKPVLRPYRKAADVIEASGTDYTILRPTWFIDADEVDFELTRKGEPEKGSVVSQKSVATVVATIIQSPDKYIGESLGVNKPGS